MGPCIYDDSGNERELPFKWEICCGCNGHGTSSAYLGAFTADQMHEDPDFAEEYCSGHYDRTCEKCGGSGKVKTIDKARTPKALLKEYSEQCRASAECDAIQRQERLMEGGWREEGWY